MSTRSSPSSKKIAKEPAPVKKPRKLRYDPNPEHDSWLGRKKQHLEESCENSARFMEHMPFCELCNISESNKRDEFCEVGERFKCEGLKLHDIWWNFSEINPPPPQYITMIESEDGQWVPEER